MHSFRLSHAGLVLEQDSASLFVDPGNFSTEQEIEAALETSAPVAGLVITHQHADHWTPEHIHRIRQAAPAAPIFTTAATSAALTDAGISGEIHTPVEGDSTLVGPFTLDFYGSRHALLHPSMPIVDNIGIHVNKSFAWGGDSLMRPPFACDTLGIPIGAPWSKLGEVMDFVLETRPRKAFLTHDGMLSERGKQLYTARVQWCLDQVGGELLTLAVKGH